MDKDKLKFLIRNMELLIDSIKAEVYSDASSYKNSTKSELSKRPILDYDEIFEDSDLND
jgi:hypothetical protein